MLGTVLFQITLPVESNITGKIKNEKHMSIYQLDYSNY